MKEYEGGRWEVEVGSGSSEVEYCGRRKEWQAVKREGVAG